MPQYILRMLFILFLYLKVASNAFSLTPDSVFVEGNRLYAEGRYSEAAALYQQVVDSGYVASELFFNLGNAYFKQNLIAHAILNYERALLLNPGNDDIRFNLEMANSFTLDKIDPLPEIILVIWFKGITSLLNASQWAWLSLLFFAATLGLLLVFWFARSRFVKRLCFSLAFFSLLLVFTTMLFASCEKQKLTKREYAIVMQPVVAVKSSPGETGKDIFILHAGYKVKVTNSLGEWNEVRIANGSKGWLPKSAIERI